MSGAQGNTVRSVTSIMMQLMQRQRQGPGMSNIFKINLTGFDYFPGGGEDGGQSDGAVQVVRVCVWLYLVIVRSYKTTEYDALHIFFLEVIEI